MYDYIIIKPELNENTLEHYGIKGMKWRRKKKTDKLVKAYNDYETYKKLKYKDQQKVQGYRKNNLTNRGYNTAENQNYVHVWPGETFQGKKNDSNEVHRYHDNRHSGNVERGIAAGRERAKKRKK